MLLKFKILKNQHNGVVFVEKLDEITLKQFLIINQRKVSEAQEQTAQLFEKVKEIDKVTQDISAIHKEGYDIKFFYNRANDKLSYKVVR